MKHNGSRTIAVSSPTRSRGAKPPQGAAHIDPQVERWFNDASAVFAPVRSSIIPMLQSAQARFGYLPRDAMRLTARYLKVATVTLEGVASFYAQFRFDKPGRHRVTVCRGTACYVRGSEKLIETIRTELSIVPGGTSGDGEITLEAVSCFGACALAPVVVVDGRVNGRVDATSLKTLIAPGGKPARTARRSKVGA